MKKVALTLSVEFVNGFLILVCAQCTYICVFSNLVILCGKHKEK